MTKSQNPSPLISPGYRSQRTQRQISLNQGCSNRTPRFQFSDRGSIPGSTGIRHCQTKRLQPFLQYRNPCRSKAACHQRRTFGQQRSICNRPMRFRPVQNIQHVLDRCQQAVVRIGKSRTICNSSHQFAVNVHRTAAHTLGNASAALHYLAAGPDQNLISHGITACHSQHFPRKGFYCITGNNCLCIAPHPRLQIFHRHQRCPGKGLHCNR